MRKASPPVRVEGVEREWEAALSMLMTHRVACAVLDIIALRGVPSLRVFFFTSRRRHTRYIGDWSSDVCSSDLRVRIPCRIPGGQGIRHGILTRLGGQGNAVAGNRSEERRVGKGWSVWRRQGCSAGGDRDEEGQPAGSCGGGGARMGGSALDADDASGRLCGPRHHRLARRAVAARLFFYKQKTAYEIHR